MRTVDTRPFSNGPEKKAKFSVKRNQHKMVVLHVLRARCWEKRYGHGTAIEFSVCLMNGLGRRLIDYTLNARCVRQLPPAS